MLLLETIRIDKGKAHYLSYHIDRMQRSCRALFDDTCRFENLETFLLPPDKTALWRCRILYDTSVRHISYHPYTPQPIRRIKAVEADIDYRYKYADRSALDELKAAYTEYDDVLIVKHGYISDTTVANIAFFDGTHWLTPDTPLLEGTTRARLIREGKITPVRITPEMIASFQGVALMNAMIGFTPINDIQIDL